MMPTLCRINQLCVLMHCAVIPVVLPFHVWGFCSLCVFPPPLPCAVVMGRESELFKAAQSGNTAVLEKAFANHLKRLSGGPHHGSSLGRWEGLGRGCAGDLSITGFCKILATLPLSLAVIQ